jgi:NADPH-dependent glutamate synthase beta subunit-like oxidoreductase
MLLTALHALYLALFIATSCEVRASRWKQTVFDVEHTHQSDLPASNASTSAYRGVKKIAVIGAGPGGTSTAYFLSRAHSKLEEDGRGGEGFEITLFERDERIGGRTAVVKPYFDDGLDAIELGASIFADVNMNLKRIAKVRLSVTYRGRV